MQSGLGSTSTGHNTSALQCSLDSAQRVVYRPLHFVQCVIVGSSQNDRCRGEGLGTLDKDALIVRDALLCNLLCVTQVCRLELLVTVQIGKSADECRSGGLCYPAQILFLAPSYCHRALLDKVLEAKIVDTLGR